GVLALNNPAERARLWELPDRRVVMMLALGAGIVFITLMTLVFAAAGSGTAAKPATASAPAAAKPAAAEPASGLSATRLGIMLLDYPSKHFLYPFTIQHLMHLLLYIGLRELFGRWQIGRREMLFLANRYLPEDEETVLQFA